MQTAAEIPAAAARSAGPVKFRVPLEKLPFAEFFCLHRKFLLLNFLNRNLKLKYRRSLFGYLWTLLIPLSQVVIFYFVYKVVLKVEIPNYISFIISGLLPWVFFASSISESMEALVANHSLLVHAPVPIQVFPLSVAVANFVNLLPSIPLIYVVFAVDSHSIPSAWSLLIIPLCGVLLVFTYSLSFILSCLFVHLRDLKHLIGIVIQLWLYITPVLYSSAMIPKGFHWINWVNPVSGFFIAIRQTLFEHRFPDILPLGAFVVWSFGTLLLAEWYRVKFGKHIVEMI